MQSINNGTLIHGIMCMYIGPVNSGNYEPDRLMRKKAWLHEIRETHEET